MRTGDHKDVVMDQMLIFPKSFFFAESEDLQYQFPNVKKITCIISLYMSPMIPWINIHIMYVSLYYMGFLTTTRLFSVVIFCKITCTI